MISKIVIYTLLVLIFDIFMFMTSSKHSEYLKIEDYFKILNNPLYKKSLLSKIFVINCIVVLFSIIF